MNRGKRSVTTDSEVTPMDARARILAIRLMEMIGKYPVYAQSLGVEAGMKTSACMLDKRLPLC